jgi:membrane protease YdiL (CAAX protease family)
MVQKDVKEFLEMGSKLHELGGLEEALTYYLKALDYLKNSEDKKTEADALLEVGNIYIEREDYKNGQEYYEKSLEAYTTAEDETGEGYALTGIGLILEKLGRFVDARRYYIDALNKFEEKDDRERQAVIRSLIAGTYESQGAWEDALIEYKRSSKIFGNIGNHEKKARIDKLIEGITGKRSKTQTTRNEKISAVIYLIGLIVAELIVTLLNKEVGLVLETVILFALLLNSSFNVSYNYSVLLRSMMVLPMIRIIGLSIPLMQVQPLYWFPIIAIPLFAASYTIMKSQGLTRSHIGLIWGNKKVQLLIALTGIFLGTIEYMILQPKPLIATLNPTTLIIASIILIISTGLAEELLFRGIIQKNAENVYGTILGLLYTSLLFTALHIGWDSFYDLIFVFGVAMFYGYAFQKTRSIVGVTLSHGISNTFLFLIVPFYAPLIFNIIPF